MTHPPGTPISEPSESLENAAESDHGLAHTTPIKLLIGVFLGLVVLTILTVAVTSFDLGAQWNLIVAMVIATLKAGLVVVFFMHLLWDKKFHLLVFLSGVLFLILFLAMASGDRSEYQPTIDQLQQDQAQIGNG